MEYFKQRWQIETLFRGLKSSGFNIEDTHVTDLERLGKLFSLTMIAFVWCYNFVQFFDENNIILCNRTKIDKLQFNGIIYDNQLDLINAIETL